MSPSSPGVSPLLPAKPLAAAPDSSPNQPEPAPVLALGHCFYVPALGRADSLLHPPAHISSEAWLTAEALVLHFQSPPDEVYFKLNRSQVPAAASWLGSHALRSQRHPAATAEVWYHYTRPDATGLQISTLQLGSQSRWLKGCLAITAYDARRKLVSGYYEVRAGGQRDPARTPDATDCTIILAGDFNFVKLRLGG